MLVIERLKKFSLKTNKFDHANYKQINHFDVINQIMDCVGARDTSMFKMKKKMLLAPQVF